MPIGYQYEVEGCTLHSEQPQDGPSCENSSVDNVLPAHEVDLQFCIVTIPNQEDCILHLEKSRLQVCPTQQSSVECSETTGDEYCL